MGVSYVQTDFRGGEWSQTAQGQMGDPHYRTALAASQNGMPVEAGPWSRCSGSQFIATTRTGAKGRVISFDVNDENPIMLAFTDGYLRFIMFDGDNVSLALTAAPQVVSAISTDNPAKVTVSAAPSTGATMLFSGLGTNNPLLQNRQFLATNVDGTHFTIADAITDTDIDGSTVGSFVSGSVGQILELTTTYLTGSWENLRSVQAEAQAVLLNGTQPQVLTMMSPPGATYPTFTLEPSDFVDGPYLDPFSGSIVTYNALEGNVVLTFSFQAYSSSVSYSVGDYVESSSVGYQSLQDANLNNTPASSPTFWTPVNGGAPVGPNGFTSGDIGRHIRLFSEPSPWASGSTYDASDVVKYNGAYWQSLISSNTGNIPGTNAADWVPVTGVNYAQWTWGRIISVSGSGQISVSSTIGNMSNVADAFNGTPDQGSADSASASNTQTTYPQWVAQTGYGAGTGVYYSGNLYQCGSTFSEWPGQGTYAKGTYFEYQGNYYVTAVNVGPLVPITSSDYVNLGSANPTNTNVWSFLGVAPTASIAVFAGANLSASAKAISGATVFPSSDLGYGMPGFITTLWLFGSNSAPTSWNDGTLLGSVTNVNQFGGAIGVPSNNTTSTWGYVWIAMTGAYLPPLPDNGSHSYTLTGYIAQIEFFTPNAANGSVITVQIAGPPLLYDTGTVVYTWQAGVYSDTNGWPTGGCYFQGRLWLAGAQYNRLDASQSNDLFTFSPTGPDGTVADNNGISYTLNSRGVNTIFWMEPDAQGIIIGTDGGEFLAPGTPQNPITPSNISVQPITKADCANIEPVRTEHTLCLVQARQRKIMEQFADVFSGKFTAPNLMDKARHLTAGYIEEIRYQREITPTIWARMGDGTLAGGVYKRDTLMTSSGPTFMGWWRRVLGSGRLVESIAVGPSQNGTLDALVMVTNDPQTGIRHIELQADLFEETDTYADGWFLDDAVTPLSYAVSPTGITINGLWHLNGKTVQVFAAGLDCGAQNNPVTSYADFTVSNGSVTVAFGDGIAAGNGYGLFTQAFVNSFPAGQMPLVVGFTYTSQGQLVRPESPAETGTRAGPAFGKLRKHSWWMMQVVNTNGLSIGFNGFGNMDPAQMRQIEGVDSITLPTLYSGVVRDTVGDLDDETLDGQLSWQFTRPAPGLITAIGGVVEAKDL